MTQEVRTSVLTARHGHTDGWGCLLCCILLELWRAKINNPPPSSPPPLHSMPTRDAYAFCVGSTHTYTPRIQNTHTHGCTCTLTHRQQAITVRTRHPL